MTQTKTFITRAYCARLYVGTQQSRANTNDGVSSNTSCWVEVISGALGLIGGVKDVAAAWMQWALWGRLRSHVMHYGTLCRSGYVVIEKGESWVTWQMLRMARAILGWVDMPWAWLRYVVAHRQNQVR